MYFGPEQEELIKEYVKTRDDGLYKAHIHPLLKSIAYGVRAAHNYSPKAYYTSDGVINGCISLQWEKLITNWDPQRDKKAFSYLTVVARNYFYHVSKKANKKESTFHHIRLEAERHWERANEYSTDRETTLIEHSHTLIRNETGRKFLKEYLHATPKQEKKIISKLDALPRAHKKAVRDIIFKTLKMGNHRITSRGHVRVKKGDRKNIQSSMSKNLSTRIELFKRYELSHLKKIGDI